jgi:glycosyltransferase involved in cell wall biosynthesis
MKGEVNKEVVVSICCVTYNHESFIGTCLDGFINQVTDFDFEILIHDDASSDKTQSIIKRYEEKYPGKIRSVYQSENQWLKNGRNPLIEILFPMAQGKYIALCEGDDYWTDPYKLQKQIDILNANPDCAACHHWQKIAVKNESGIYEEKEAPKNGRGYFEQRISTVKDIFENKVRIKTRTVVFKNIFKEGFNLPDWFYKLIYADVPLSFILGKFGKFIFLDEEMAVYRITNTGISVREVKNYNWQFVNCTRWLQIWCYADKYYDRQYHGEAMDTIHFFYTRMMQQYEKSLRMKLKIFMHVFFCLDQSFVDKLRIMKLLLERKTAV